MKIEIELPDWVDERDIYVMAGIELAAYKFAAEKKFHVKTSRCNQCGKCCEWSPQTPYYPSNPDGSCSKLIPDGPDKKVCSIAVYRPFPCAYGDPVMGRWSKDFCSIRYDGEK